MAPSAVEPALDIGRGIAPASLARVATDGKFLRLRAAAPAAGAEAAGGNARFRVKGVTYGTFAPDANGYQFPALAQVAADFRLMTEFGINTVRVYTPPNRDLLDEAARNRLRVMVGLPWSQHVAFLDDAKLARKIRRELVGRVAEFADHPAVLMLAIGNEIPAPVVRWHGGVRVERFLRELYHDAKSQAPETLFTYVNFPPTEFLDLSFFDVCAFNVYLHREQDLRAYLARLQNIAGHKPLLLAEAGADSLREGEDGQAEITATHIRAAFEEGACGAIAFAWTDEWWRGGHPVDDWNFGLVDRDRKPKPAALAVKKAFDNAPFPPEVQTAWPRISVVVCAYNAADTLEDCLASLDTLTYPDYEVILVNDGSKDRTSEIGHKHPRVRVIDIPNGGLSAARNVGLAAATGEIVAYTDADVCVDRDWLTFLVQPFLKSDVVGSGGPNVVPSDDAPMAQSIARAPGGPTHVLLDDRTAEHVPGCNMAFRREALLAIGGFNPIYLRAGDDVDVCWRLQARGWKIGFSGAALVWHHHRSSVKAYWRQQVGYGEGETWLMAHHPDKFLDGQMLWHGRIYSPLPFVRSLWGTKINAGVWGTAAFPSVYRTDVHPFAFLPHSIKWQVLSFALTLAGIVTALIGGHSWSAVLLLATGIIGIAVTFAKNLAYAFRSDISSLPGNRLWYRATVAYLHLIQPVARLRGRIRGLLSPPEVALPQAQRQTSGGPRPSLGEAWRALLLISGSVTEDRYWSEHWTTADRVLAKVTDWLRRSRAVRTIAIDEGWSNDRDVSVFIGRWAWLDIRALVEEHGGGKSLLRVSTHLRPTTFGVVTAVAIGSALLVGASAHLLTFTSTTQRLTGLAASVLTLLICALAAWRTAQATAIVRRGIDQVARNQGMTALKSGPARVPLLAPSLLRQYGMRSAIIFVVMVFALGASTLMLRRVAKGEVVFDPHRNAPPGFTTWVETPLGIAVSPTGAIYFADSLSDVVWRREPGAVDPWVFAGNQNLGTGFSGDAGPATRAQLDTPDGVCVAPDGDLVIADSHNDRIRRVDLPTRIITTVAGSGANGYDGDDKAATDAALNTPNSVACAPNGDIYIADTLNNRVRMIDAKTGLIHTIAGDGTTGDAKSIGDGGPAVTAQLFMPSDVALDPRRGDVYIADMHHNRIRRIDGRNHVITTIAGDGRWASAGDDGPAITASLQGPSGIVVVPAADGKVTIFVAESYSGHVRAIGPDGISRDLSDEGRTVFGQPTRIAFDPRTAKLYVADSSKDQVVEMQIPDVARKRFAIAPRPVATPAPRRSS